MIDTNQASEYTLVLKGREFMEKGEFKSAIECYRKVHDPDAEDEGEARDMLIEAHALLSRKHLIEALEHFEEALVMGTDVQRRQAVDGIAKIAEIRSKLGSVTANLKKNFDALGVPIETVGMSFISDTENVILITAEALEKLPANLVKSSKISKLPHHLLEMELPIQAQKCLPYADDEDIKYIIDVANELKKRSSESQQ